MIYFPLLEKYEGVTFNRFALRQVTLMPIIDAERFTNHASLVETWDGRVWIVPDHPEHAAYETSPYKMNGEKKREMGRKSIPVG